MRIKINKNKSVYESYEYNNNLCVLRIHKCFLINGKCNFFGIELCVIIFIISY